MLVASIDNRPWSEKYAPKSADELALNKAKVREVQSWLEGVLNGTSRQRVLVLKGPAGTGKTATVEALAGELGVEILEWGNPINAPLREDYREEGAFSSGLSGFFEEFVGRAPKFGGLDLAWSSGEKASTRTPSSQASMADNGMKRLVVVEDFPNTLFTSSTAPLQSFRHTIKSFLAIPPPQPGDGPLPILILIITETASISGPDSFTAHRLLSPEILHHPLVHEINFNKIAPSYMVKALSSIIAQESQQSGRKLGPSKAMLDALSSSGDIRSAIMGLEFLAMNGDLPDKGFSEPIKTTKRRGRPPDRDLNPAERQVLLAVTQRESSFGIFHATGKVVYNKRYGDDPDDPYSPTQIRPPLPNLPYHARAIRIDLDALIDETGTDPQTFIAGIHENFLSSCNPGGIPRQLATADEDILDVVNACLDNLSDSDLLGSRGYGYDSRGGGGGDTAGIRADEISFHTAVRGVMLSLPSPVKRFRDGCSLSNKMFYPMSARLWRERQEIEDSVEWFVGKERETDLCRGGKAEALQERMPYLALIERRREWAGKSVVVRDPAVAAALDKVTVFGSVRKQSDELGEEKVVEKKAGVQAGWRGGVEKKAEWVGIGEAVESLVLSDDDIEDF